MNFWVTKGRNALWDRSHGRVLRVGSEIGLLPRTANALEGGAQGADILTFTRIAAGTLGPVVLSNVNPAGALQMNADGVTLEYGPLLLDADFVSDVTATATYTVNGASHAFLITVHIAAIGLPAGGNLTFNVDVTADENAPILSNFSAVKNGSVGFTASVSTDTAEGTIRYVVYPEGAAAPNYAQIDAGTDGSGAAAPGGLRTKAVTAVGSQDLSGSGVNPATAYRIAAYHVDLAPNKSAVEVSNPFTTDNPLQFLGDGYVGSSSAVTTHTFANAIRPGNTPLPTVFGAGKYAVLIGTTSAVSAVTVDGTAATEKASSASGNMVYAHEADIAGGGTGTIQVTVSPATNNIAISVWKIPAGMTFQQAIIATSHANPTNIVMDATTLADQCAIALRISNGTTPPDSTWTGLTEVAPDKAIPNTTPARSFSAAHTLDLAGGSPEQFRCALDATFISAKGILVVYG